MKTDRVEPFLWLKEAYTLHLFSTGQLKIAGFQLSPLLFHQVCAHSMTTLVLPSAHMHDPHSHVHSGMLFGSPWLFQSNRSSRCNFIRSNPVWWFLIMLTKLRIPPNLVSILQNILHQTGWREKKEEREHFVFHNIYYPEYSPCHKFNRTRIYILKKKEKENSWDKKKGDKNVFRDALKQ